MAVSQPSATVTIAANGTGTATLLNRSVQNWTVSQVSVRLDAAPVGAVCNLFYNGAFVSAIIPTGDSAGGDPPVILFPSDSLSVTWEGCTPGQMGTVLWLYDNGVN